MHAAHTILLKDIVTDAARSAARVFKYPPVVNWKDKHGMIPRDVNTATMPPRATTPVRIGAGTLVYPTRMGIQDIGSPRRSIGPQEVRNAEPLHTSINGIYSKHRDPAPTWSKVTSHKLSDESISDVYSRCRMNLAHDTILTESPNFMDLGLLSVHTTDELRYVFIFTNTIGSPAYGSNWIPPGHRSYSG